MNELPINRFKRDLAERQQIGLFSTLGSPALVELLARCGYDWLLIDTEHSPLELPDVIAHLRALNALSTAPIVRPAWNDTVLVKRLLDAGVQSLLFPYVQSEHAAEAAVQATRYPPQGVRGVSGSSRAAGYGLIPDYLHRIPAEIELAERLAAGRRMGETA